MATQQNVASAATNYTLTGLRRWSCIDKELPNINQIKHLHVYDFDNTLFSSPLPNKQLWQGPTVGMLQTQEAFINGGWWHDSNILAATGKGLQAEEPRAWEGWWNEQIVNLVELSMQQKDALTVFLTGRSESGFSELLQRMVKAKRLDFDMMCLKPAAGPANQKFPSTIKYKQALLDDLVHTYKDAEEIRIYEDRPKHVMAFRNYLTDLNTSFNTSYPPSRKPIKGEVIEVADIQTELNPEEEVAQIQRMINVHNVAVKEGAAISRAKSYEIKKNVLFTGYMVSPEDTKSLLNIGNLPSGEAANDIRTMANGVIIAPFNATEATIKRAGGFGHRVTWRVVGTGTWEKNVWAARLEPVPASQQCYTESLPPMIVLAVRRNARPADAKNIKSWDRLPTEKQFDFETKVGEKAILRIEEERQPEIDTQPYAKKPRLDNDDFPPLGSDKRAPSGSNPQQRSYHTDQNRRSSGNAANNQKQNGSQRGRGGGSRQDSRHQGGSGRGRGGGGGGGGSFRGRARGGGYRSLDDDPSYRSNNKNNGYGMDGTNDDGGLSY